MVFTLVGEDFAAWVRSIVNERNARVVANQNLTISMDPEIAKAFHSSKMVSCKSLSQPKGKFHG